jgi:serine/threonine protein kinase
MHQHDLSVQFKGSLAYLAPEVIRQDAFDPFKADVWSLGVTFYAMAAGKLPWPEQLKQAQFYDYICGGLRDVDPVVPPEFVEILRTMIVGDPAKRISLEDINTEALHHTIKTVPKSKTRIGRAWMADLAGVRVSSSCAEHPLNEMEMGTAVRAAASAPKLVPLEDERRIVRRVASLRLTAETAQTSGLTFQIRAARHFLRSGVVSKSSPHG